MVIFRLIALILVVVALLLLGYDALSYLKDGENFQITSLVEAVRLVPGMAADWSPPENWPSFANTVVGWPSWGVIGVVGLVLALIFRRRD